MRKPIVLLLLVLLLSGNSHSQWFNRIYTTFGAGFPLRGELGAYLHVFRHLTIAYNAGISNARTGPKETVPSPFFGTKEVTMREEYGNQSLLVGATTRASCGANISLAAGISAIRAENCLIIPSYDSWTPDKKVWQTNRYNSFTMRCEIIKELRPLLGIHIAAQKSFNRFYDEFSLTFGINIGLVRDWEHLWDQD
jgi:hypothetical protein